MHYKYKHYIIYIPVYISSVSVTIISVRIFVGALVVISVYVCVARRAIGYCLEQMLFL